jgi:hypothetical protein
MWLMMIVIKNSIRQLTTLHFWPLSFWTFRRARNPRTIPCITVQHFLMTLHLCFLKAWAIFCAAVFFICSLPHKNYCHRQKIGSCLKRHNMQRLYKQGICKKLVHYNISNDFGIFSIHCAIVYLYRKPKNVYLFKFFFCMFLSLKQPLQFLT